MRSESRFRLISHTKHDMNFDDVCDDVKLDIEEMKTRHHVFVVAHADHQLMLSQFFLTNLNVNYDYRLDEIYAILTNLDLNRSIIFKILDRNDFANKIKENVFSDDDSFLN
jgi:hypothetical protein